MKNIVKTAVFISLLYGSITAAPLGIVGVDTPTAFTIGRGTYNISFLAYDNGGMELKTLLGLHDQLFLGVSFDVQNAIGQDKPNPNVPGVIARLKLTDGFYTFPIAIALGYDSFYIGTHGEIEDPENSINRMLYGPYLVFTGPIYLFYGQQFVSLGIRVPTQPDYLPEDTSYFSAIDIPLGLSFNFKTEVERVYYNLRQSEDWLVNFALRYTYLEQLSIEMAVLWNPGETPNRVLRIEYRDVF